MRSNIITVPLIETSAYINCIVASDVNFRIRAFIHTDIINHLHVIIVSESVLHRLSVTAIVFICAVYKYNRLAGDAVLTLRYPFVPSGYKNHLRIFSYGIFPLLCKIVTHVYCTVRCVIGSVVPASAAVVGSVPCCCAETCGTGMLGD